MTALVATTVLTVLTGVVYPLAVWVTRAIDFPAAWRPAARSLAGDQVVGSSLIAAEFFVAPIFSEPAFRRRATKGYAVRQLGRPRIWGRLTRR